MIEDDSDQSVYDIAIEVADERGDSDLKERLQQLKDDKSVQVARAKAVLSALTGGLRECPFEELASRIDSVIQKNLDSNSIWDFLLLCGDHMSSLRDISFYQIARVRIAQEEQARILSERKAVLTAAGKEGGKARSQRYELIKQWALKEAGNMRHDDKQIARTLAATLPEHLKRISDDPERLIYDTLRASRKS